MPGFERLLTPTQIYKNMLSNFGDQYPSYVTLKDKRDKFSKDSSCSHLYPSSSQYDFIRTPRSYRSDDFEIATKIHAKCRNFEKKCPGLEAPRSTCARFRRDARALNSNRVFSIGKSATHFYDSKTKHQSMKWRHCGSPRPRKFRV